MKDTPSADGTAAFTLVELLAVLLIISILIALVAPSIKGIMKAYQLTIAGQTIVGQLSLARQTAVASNHAVQVRFYLLPDYNQPATTTVTGTSGVYRALQCFKENDATTYGASPTVTPLTKVTFFPPVVKGGTNANSSYLLSQTPLLADPTQSLPVYGSNYEYIEIRFSPGGGATLISGSASATLSTTSNTLTFMSESDKITDTTNGLPANYLSLTIDPVTGTLQGFRP